MDGSVDGESKVYMWNIVYRVCAYILYTLQIIYRKQGLKFEDARWRLANIYIHCKSK